MKKLLIGWAAVAATLIGQSTGFTQNPSYAAIWERPGYVAHHGLSSADYSARYGQYHNQGYRLVDVSGYAVNGASYYAAIWEQSIGMPPRVSEHGLTQAEYQSRFDFYVGQGYRPVHVNGHSLNGIAYYAGLWEQGSAGPAWAAHHGLTGAQYQERFDTYLSLGYRLVDVSGFSVNGTAVYTGIWEQRPGPAWAAHHGLTGAQYQERFDYYTSQGYRPVRVSGYEINGVPHYAGLWEYSDGRAWVARHGISAAQYQQEFDLYLNQGYRLVCVSAFSINGTSYYSAIWDSSSGQPAWASNHGLTSSDYQDLFLHYVNHGYRLTDISGYEVNGIDYYAGVWERRSGPPWSAYHRVHADQYQSLFDQNVNAGFRLARVSGYALNGEPHYALLWERNDGRAWASFNRMTTSEYQNRFNQYIGQGYRLTHVNTYSVGEAIYYAAIWEQRNGPDWATKHHMTSAQYASNFTYYANQGYRVVRVSGCRVHGVDFYAALWEKNSGSAWVSYHGLSDSDYVSLFHYYAGQGYRLVTVQGHGSTGPVPSVPATGVSVPELAPFDDAMKRFIASRNIPAAVICVSRDGKIVLERAYGYLDRNNTVPLKTSAMFRIASLSKPITAAAVRRLAAAGRLSLSAKVFNVGQPGGGLLSITPFGTADTRLRDITVEHLLNHQGGWDRYKSGDPMFNAISIAQTLGVDNPPTQRDFVRYMMGRPLDFTPGSKSEYSNFGYLLLGLIVEQITGEDYTAHVQREIFAPQGAASTEVELGASLFAFRNPREPWYSHPSVVPNVFDPTEPVFFPDGGFYLEAMEAHGGLISTARSYVQFMHGYWLNGQVRSGNGQSYYFFGSLPGTYALALQRADGVNVAVFFNQRDDNDGYRVIKDIMESAADAVQIWPSTDIRGIAPFRPRLKADFITGSAQIDTEEGRIYQLQASDDLVSWWNVGAPIVGNGLPAALTMPMPVANRQFFRIRAE